MCCMCTYVCVLTMGWLKYAVIFCWSLVSNDNEVPPCPSCEQDVAHTVRYGVMHNSHQGSFQLHIRIAPRALGAWKS